MRSISSSTVETRGPSHYEPSKSIITPAMSGRLLRRGAGAAGDGVRGIGVLMSGDDDLDGRSRVSAFTQALADVGCTDGRNVRMDLGAALRRGCPNTCLG
jgi:hypothetical protein